MMLRVFLRLVCCGSLIWMSVVSAGANGAQTDTQQLLRHFKLFKQRQTRDAENRFRLPFTISSRHSRDESAASTRYFLSNVEFKKFVSLLSEPRNWCEFIPFHLNIKACAVVEREGEVYLQFYVGYKGFMEPQDAHKLQLSFKPRISDGVFSANLFAQEGPLYSSDIDFNLRAIETAQPKGVFIEYDIVSDPGFGSRLLKLYLATVARNKVGFSQEGETKAGKPKLVAGARGATERNIVRYLLTIETYFATRTLAQPDRFNAGMRHWFDATNRYRRQLFEVGREKYIENKLRERENQKMLQSAIDAGRIPPFAQ